MPRKIKYLPLQLTNLILIPDPALHLVISIDVGSLQLGDLSFEGKIQELHFKFLNLGLLFILTICIWPMVDLSLQTYVAGINYSMTKLSSEDVTTNYIYNILFWTWVCITIALVVKRLASLQTYNYYEILTNCIMKAV